MSSTVRSVAYLHAEDSDPTGGYKFSKEREGRRRRVQPVNAAESDIDYYYASRLPGEPIDEVNDIHLHPTLPRTACINLVVGF